MPRKARDCIDRHGDENGTAEGDAGTGNENQRSNGVSPASATMPQGPAASEKGRTRTACTSKWFFDEPSALYASGRRGVVQHDWKSSVELTDYLRSGKGVEDLVRDLRDHLLGLARSILHRRGLFSRIEVHVGRSFIPRRGGAEADDAELCRLGDSFHCSTGVANRWSNKYRRRGCDGLVVVLVVTRAAAAQLRCISNTNGAPHAAGSGLREASDLVQRVEMGLIDAVGKALAEAGPASPVSQHATNTTTGRGNKGGAKPSENEETVRAYCVYFTYRLYDLSLDEVKLDASKRSMSSLLKDSEDLKMLQHAQRSFEANGDTSVILPMLMPTLTDIDCVMASLAAARQSLVEALQLSASDFATELAQRIEDLERRRTAAPAT